MNPPVAAIDLGTNTVRLLIGRVGAGGSSEQLLLKRHITRLGGGFTRERGISEEARGRTMAALQDFAAEISAHNVERVRAVATSAVRDAVNGEDFCREVLERTGIRMEVIDGNEEALLTLRGVFSGLDDKSGDFLVFDPGGGSTEYTLAREEMPLYCRSLPLGVVRLTEGKSGSAAMADKIERELAPLAADLARMGLSPMPGSTTLVGTAGTPTTLAAISLKMTDYDYRKVNNHVVGLEEITEIYNRLLPLPPAERLKVPGLEHGREDLIIAGILITIKTMELFGFTSLKVSDFGLLEGVLRSMTGV